MLIQHLSPFNFQPLSITSILHPPSFTLHPSPLILQSYRKSRSLTLIKPFLSFFFSFLFFFLLSVLFSFPFSFPIFSLLIYLLLLILKGCSMETSNMMLLVIVKRGSKMEKQQCWTKLSQFI